LTYDVVRGGKGGSLSLKCGDTRAKDRVNGKRMGPLSDSRREEERQCLYFGLLEGKGVLYSLAGTRTIDGGRGGGRGVRRVESFLTKDVRVAVPAMVKKPRNSAQEKVSHRM